MKGRSRDKETLISKRMSYVLRHAPESIGLSLDRAGWANVDELLSRLAQHGKTVSREELDSVVANNNKKRFEFSEDGSQIRARQGHSIAIELEYEPIEPPGILYHGTAERFLDSIFEKGLLKQGRHHVHLSTNQATMRQVGGRHGKAVLLKIESGKMHEAGHEFFITGNDVWLTDHVPPEYLSRVDE